MSDGELRLNTPARLLDRADGGLGELLLRSSSGDGPPQGALQRALIASSAAVSGVVVATSAAASTAGSAASTASLKGALAATTSATAGAAVHATAGASAALATSGVVFKSILAWTLGGCVLGAVASGATLELSTQGSWRKPAAAAPHVTIQARAAQLPERTPARAPATRAPAASLEVVPPQASVDTRDSEPAPISGAVRAPARSQSARTLGPNSAPVPLAAPSSEPEPTSAAKPSASAKFSEELALIDAARARLRAGDANGALELVRMHRTRFAQGQLGPEALAVAIEAELQSGRSAEAHAAAARFFSAYPSHPLAARVRSLLKEP